MTFYVVGSVIHSAKPFVDNIISRAHFMPSKSCHYFLQIVHFVYISHIANYTFIVAHSKQFASLHHPILFDPVGKRSCFTQVNVFCDINLPTRNRNIIKQTPTLNTSNRNALQCGTTNVGHKIKSRKFDTNSCITKVKMRGTFFFLSIYLSDPYLFFSNTLALFLQQEQGLLAHYRDELPSL